MTEELNASRLDHAFAYFLSQRSTLNDEPKKAFSALILKLSSHQTQGHNCIHLNKEEQQLVTLSGLVKKRDRSPLVLENNHLYLQRYWVYEDRLARQIKRLLSLSRTPVDSAALLEKYFPNNGNGEIDWQREACKKAVSQSFSMITGGPGTGKTTTVLKILAILLELADKEGIPLHIALATPTGKAAQRLQESIGAGKKTLQCSADIKQKIPEAATTIHRLLGVKYPTPYFKHHAENPLAFDIVIVDEASMVDLALMSKLVDALKPTAKFILLGDQNQLASVESGAVLRDLTTALPQQTIELQKSYRFKGAIKDLADAVNKQLYSKAWGILTSNHPHVSLLEDDLIHYATKQYAIYLRTVLDKAPIEAIFTALNQFQVLCAMRQSERGVGYINQKIEEKLTQQFKLNKMGVWYLGRPIMVLENNTEVSLYNGDIGIYLRDKNAKSAVFFPQADGSIKKVLPNRLPHHESVFAMSIHKSQGSEFDECLCVLPDKMNPVLSKELVYTAITRAKKTLKIASSYSIFSQTLQQKITRAGGLAEKLRMD